ncbi:putative ABC transport system ATP-binding protein [Rhizobium azooxidifex]|uniref:Putative ABC transport system ATP-binding protein n=1 Tax=Mycoplana azooxidifex TaxID=1636188 RepID=A0A7W6D3J8_9HYPH|nr:ABC transporter ATP-binding protein [Mycoplana azooxidifex]MBB3976116.1 putative ABC transport system ATP-binding protein [Mycoplana azooxidifex]
MEKGLTHYIWTHTRPQQLWILFIVAVSMIPYFLSFDLPKQIVNGPIQGQGFEGEAARQLFMRIEFGLPFVGNVVFFPGIELNRLEMLIALSLVFLALVVVNGLFKLYINTYKGRLGERLLRRIRFELVDRVLRFPPSQFKRIKGAEISSMIKDEVEPMGGFTGDAFVAPALLGGQAATALFFIFVQNVWLGLIAGIIVAVQAVLIPRMRRRLLVLGRERQLTARELAGRVSEIVEGINTIHAYDTSNFERADIAARLGRIFKIRYDLYQWKFLVKFINNFLASVTPFLFYLIGGYLALQGRLDIGQLVAVIAAYKDLPGPLKELIDWDQARQDVQVKYNQVVEQFKVDNLIDPAVQEVSTGEVAPLAGALAVANLTLADDSGAHTVEHISVQFPRGEYAAIIGGAAAGGDTLAEAIGRSVWPESGRIALGDADLFGLPESVVGRRITYVSSDAYFFYGTLRDNLLYSLKHAPLREPEYEDAHASFRKWEITEARMAGNPDHDIESDWIDYEAAGATGPEDLFASVTAVLDSVYLTKDILELALRSSVDPLTHEELTSHIVKLRHTFRDELDKAGLSNLVVPFEPDRYNIEATVGENLLFGTAIGEQLVGRAIGRNAYFREVVGRSGLDRMLYQMGYEIAENAVELFAGLPPDHPFFQQLTFMTPDDIPMYQQLLQKLKGKDFAETTDEDKHNIIRLSFAYIEPRHRFGLLTDELMKTIVDVRLAFHEGLPESLKGAIDRYDPHSYMPSASLMDNVLFGRVSHRHADGPERVRTMVIALLSEPGLYDQVLSIGLEFNLGAGGRRLTQVQRQKLNLARALLRRSDYYIFNRPLPALDGRTQEQICRNVLTLVRDNNDKNTSIIWVLTNTTLTDLFDRVLIFDKGRLVGDGKHAELADNATFRELVS